MSEKVEEKVAKAGSYYFDQLNKEQQKMNQTICGQALDLLVLPC